MEPDPDSPLQRVERTLISVWCYITEAVSRFLRPQPAETANNNEAVHESRVESEPPDCSQTEADARGEEASGEQSTVSLLSSSSPVFAGERCIAEVDVKPKEEDRETKENIIEEQHSQTGNEHAGQLVTEGTKEHQGRKEKTEIEKWNPCEESETPEKDREHATGAPGHMQLKEAVSGGMEPREEKELLSTVVLDDHRKVVETLENIQDDDRGEIEEGLEEHSKMQECTQTEDEDSNEETEEQRDIKVSPPNLGDVDNCEDASWRSLEIENSSNEKTIDVETQLSVCKDVCEDELANKNVQMTVSEEDLNTAANYQTPEEESEQDKSRWTIVEENVSAQNGTSSKAVQQTERDTTEFSFKEEDMLVRVMQTTSEKHVTFEEISADVDHEDAEKESLACENENSALSTVQAETQHLSYNKSSSVVEKERVQFAIIDEEDPNKPAAHEEPEQKSSRAFEDENILTQSVTSKEDDSGRGEEQFNLKGNDFADQLVSEDMTVHQLRQEKTEIQILRTCTEKEDDENKEHQENVGPEIEKRFEQADVWEEPVSTVRPDDFPKVVKDIEDESSEIQEVTGEENEDDLEEKSEIKQCTFREGDNNGELENQSKSETAAVMLEDGNICEDVSQLSPKNESLEERSQQEEHQHLVFEELLGAAEEEKIQLTVVKEEESDKYATHEEPEQKNSSRAVGDVRQEEDFVTHRGTSSEKDQGTGEKQFSLTDSEQAEPGCPKVQSYLEKKSQEILEDKGEETEVDFDEESEVKQSIIREEEDRNGEIVELRKCEAAVVMLEDANICEDPSQLSMKCKNSEEKGEQVEAQHTVCKDLSKDELTDVNVQMTVFEEGLDKAASYQTTREESEQDKSTRAGEDGQQEENVLIQSITISEEDQGTEVEKFSQIEHNQAGQDCSKTDEAKEELEDESGEIQEDDEEDFEDKSELKQLTIRAEDDSCGETGEQWRGEASAVLLEDENICEDASQLSPKSENLQERSQQEHQHLVFKELLGVAEEERIQLTIIKEEESDKYATHEEPEQKNSSRAVGDVRQEEDFVTHSTSSEKDQGTGEKQFSLTDHEQAEPGCPKVDEAKEDLEEENQEILEDEGEETEVDFEEESEVKQCIIREEENRSGETRELRKDEAASAVMLEDGNICEDVSQLIEKTKTVKCDNWEESETTDMDRERATDGSEHLLLKEAMSDRMDSNEEKEVLSRVLLDDHRKGVQTLEDIQEDDEETEESFKEESKIQQCSSTEEEESDKETEEQRGGKVSPPMLGDASRLSLDNENCSNVKTIDVETQLTACTDVLEDELTDENIQVTVFEEEDLNSVANHQTPEKESEQDKSKWTIEEEYVSAQSVTSSKAVQQTEPDTTEFSFKESVLVSCMETTSEKLVTVEESSTDVDSEETEEERLCNKEICMERLCTSGPVTVTAEGESAREINRGFNNIPPGVIEGQAALSHELYTQACKETPESVPEHNNELELDENTTQRFLERGNSKETQTIHLPEEVEVFKSSGAGGGEHLLIRQGSTEDRTNDLDLVVAEKVGGLQFVEDSEKQKRDNVNPELEDFSDEEKLELLDAPMRTEIKQSDEGFETYSADISALQDGDKTVKLEMTREDGCERRDVLAADEGVDLTDETSDSPKSEEEKMTENHLGPGLVQSFSLKDYGNLKNLEEIKPELSDENSSELLPMVFDTDKQGYTDDGELEQQIRDLNECTPLRVVGMTADLIKGQSALSQHLEANNQAPLRVFQMTGAEITTDTETADESETTTPQGLLLISEEETKHEPRPAEKYSEDPAEEHQDVIDEDILDLWIETVMSKDTDRIKEHEPGLQNDQISEESSEKKPEVMEAISAAPASISETETSLTTLYTGFLDQPFSETPIIKSGDTGLLADLNYNSEIIFDFTTSNSASALIEDTVETLQSYSREERASCESRSCPDSGVSSPEPKYPNQETGTAQEKPEEAETNTVCGDDEEALKTKANDEATVSNISDEIQSPEQRQHTEELEALLEEGSILTESTSGDEPQSEPEKQQFPLDAPEHRWSEDNLIKSFSAPSRAEVGEDRSQVNGPMLDFAVQRSRIAVKNPLARPPTDPRSLIHKPSVDPTPSLPVPGKVPAGVPLGGLGIGIKLPGIGAGFPVLKKAQRAPRDEDKPETESQKVPKEKKEEGEKTDEGKKDEAPKRPKWMPPGQPGFRNPLMSELKTKLKKTPKE